uniref:Putative tick transposon n=1 Tax=Rhipicephalus pulchellus TaxID=72859 RepID=L7M5H3_RHIPC
MIIPWTEPPLAVAGGSTVLPVGAAFLKISIGPATGAVEAAVLEDNVLPLIIGEDWFSAAQARLIFEPPKPTQLQHRATNVTIIANHKLAPRMANAVIPTKSVLFPQARPSSKDCVQRDSPPEQPLWQALAAQTLPSSSTTLVSDSLAFDTVLVHNHPDNTLPLISSQLTLSQHVMQSRQSLATMQQDRECAASPSSLANKEDPAAFTKPDDVLYRQLSSGTHAVVTPSKLRPAILQALHDGAGLSDTKCTLLKLQDCNWWPDREQSTESCASSCQCRQQLNYPTSHSVGLLHSMPTTDIPSSTIANDHVTMPPSNSKRYSLSVVDFATSCIMVAALTSVCDIIKHLHNVFHTCGTPDHCLSDSDHGSAFESHEFKRFMSLHSVELHFTTAYRPEGNGLVERSNGTLLAALLKISVMELLSWPTKLQEAAFAVNTSMNASTNFTPFQLLYGYVPKIPLQQHRPFQHSALAERILVTAVQRSESAANSEALKLQCFRMCVLSCM